MSQANSQTNTQASSNSQSASNQFDFEPAGGQAESGGGGDNGTKHRVFEIFDPATDETNSNNVADDINNMLSIVLILAAGCMIFGAIRRKYIFNKDMGR